jgi:hypothetical protein
MGRDRPQEGRATIPGATIGMEPIGMGDRGMDTEPR